LSTHYCNYFIKGKNNMRTIDAVQYFDGRRALAERLGITTQAVAKWGDAVPEGSAYKLQAVTNGRLRVDPSVYPGRRRTTKKARK
jgi:hypothetical protein